MHQKIKLKIQKQHKINHNKIIKINKIQKIKIEVEILEDKKNQQNKKIKKIIIEEEI